MDRIGRLVYMLAIAFLAFLAGAWVMLSESFPSNYFATAYQGGMALWDKATKYESSVNTDFWSAARTQQKGVTIYDEDRAANGLTLYTSGHGPRAFLVDMSGKKVHEWHLPYSKIWDESAAVKDPQPDSFMYWRKAHVYPNGDLLAIYVAAGDSPWGYGMVKLDKDSNVIWKYLEQTHHDFDIGDDGRIYALTHAISFEEKQKFLHLKVPRMDDFIVVLSPDGKEQKKVDVIDAFINSPHNRRLTRIRWYTMKSGDYIHTNSLEAVNAEFAAKRPFVSPGQVIISLREIDTLAVVDLDKQAVVWSVQGPWFSQHDPDLLPNGDILLFDNLGRMAATGGYSRLLEFDPETLEITWSYEGNEEHPFDSDVRAAQQRLDNGNTLITESTPGRIFEVTKEGDIVWEYINPVRTGPVETDHPDKKGKELIPIVSWAQRIKPDFLDADFEAASLASQQQ